MEDDSSKRGVVIKGPWKKVVDKNPPPKTPEPDVKDDLKYISEMHKLVLHQMIYTLNESGFDIESDEFIKESGFIGECIRGLMMRDLGYPNPMSTFINKVVDLDIKDGVKYANFDSGNIMKLIENNKDDKK